jgi:hypothetical protein
MNIKEKELLIDQMEEQLHRAYMINHHVSKNTCNPWRDVSIYLYSKVWKDYWIEIADELKIDPRNTKREKYAYSEWYQKMEEIRKLL